MTDRPQTQAGATGPPWPFGDLERGAYRVVVIDPPWEWKSRSPKGYKKSPNVQYQVKSIDWCARLPVRALLRPDGIVFAWGTWPLFNNQLLIFENLWGLTYKTGGVWAKRTVTGRLRWGPGFILRTVTEPFAILTNGGPGPRGPRYTNLIDGLAREHSRKPDIVYQMLDRMVPVGRRADVFGREARLGWEVFGDESTKFTPRSTP